MAAPLVLLAGGLGTRLRPAVGDHAKVSAPVSPGRPMLHHVLDHWTRLGAERILLCLGYRADEVQEILRAWDGPQHHVDVSIEPRPLGTGGALVLASPRLPERFYVANADTVLEAPLGAVARIHGAVASEATLVLSAVPAGADADLLAIDASGTIHGVLGRHRPEPGWAYGGLAMLERSLLEDWPAETPLSLEADILERARQRGARLHGVRTRRPFFDLGTPDRLRAYTTLLQRSDA